jgi:AcrR family transcriptional regulator
MDVKAGAGAPGGDDGPGAPGGQASPTAPGSEAEPTAPSGQDGASPDPAKPRTKAAQREATVAALTRAARELFAERGYASVGTEEIVRRAGVTRGALYHHFRGGKEELFRAVLVQITAETAQRVAGAARAESDPWEALGVGADAFLDACASPEVQRIVLTDGPSVLGWDVWRAIDREYGLQLIEDALRRAMDAGSVLSQPADALAQVLLGAVHEAAMVVAGADDPAAAREEMGRTLRRLLDGLRGPLLREE